MNAEQGARQALNQYDKAARHAQEAWDLVEEVQSESAESTKSIYELTVDAEDRSREADEEAGNLRAALAALLAEVTPDLDEPDEGYKMCVECGSMTQHILNEVRFLATQKTYSMWLCQEHDYDEISK